MIRVLQSPTIKEIRAIMQDIGVDPYGIRIMQSKASHYLVRMDSLPNVTANILKQEMLSLGADAALARGSLTGKAMYTGCLLMGTLSQFMRLIQKLQKQPFGLSSMGRDLSCTLKKFQQDKFTLDLKRFKLDLSAGVHIMGIVNVTPDSFSGDGLYKCQIEDVVEYACKLAEDGADIIDLGGESSRPGAKPVPLKEELARVIPAVKKLAKVLRVPISVDTRKPEVAKQALENGALILNDISGFRDPAMVRTAARYNAGAVVMHMKGSPATMQKDPGYDSLMDEVLEYLDRALRRLEDAGVKREMTIIDPGIGFGKTTGHNLEILKRLGEFKVLGRPILAGTSRKSFIGKVLNAPAQERLSGTLSSCILAASSGARVLRVHDVKPVKDALKIFEAVNQA
ncbi:MAG: dihydropteroate synthase [Candidatus Omnitrophica bacterium]|nr:dihydropteroate synthase [Candidatus Omnitrophota bacterium]